ncbi:MAG: hypothetical protein Q7K42_03590 [Candidatus Diapherotrites archaeon]|nr:hypothetical protein [Candidatus Diapherotrites archaeon]
MFIGGGGSSYIRPVPGTVVQKVLESKIEIGPGVEQSDFILKEILGLSKEKASAKREEISEFVKDSSFDKTILVNKKTFGSDVSYETVFSLSFVNNSDKKMKNVELIEEIPKSIAQKASEIKSDYNFVVLRDDPVIKFVAKELSPGQKADFNYYVEKDLNVQLLNSIPGTLILAEPQTLVDLCEGVVCLSDNSCQNSSCSPETGLCVVQSLQEFSVCGYQSTCQQGICKEIIPVLAGEKPAQQNELFNLVGAIVLILLVFFLVYYASTKLSNKKPKEK